MHLHDIETCVSCRSYRRRRAFIRLCIVIVATAILAMLALWRLGGS